MGKVKILIVEDEHMLAQYLKKFLLYKGFDVLSIVDTGIDTVKTAKELKPDIILLDIMLKDTKSGCEAALEIRGFDSKVIIIILSDHQNDEMMDYAINANVSNYLSKPYNMQDILSTIKLALAKHKREFGFDSKIINLKNGYIFDLESSQLTKNGIVIDLGIKSTRVVEILSKNYKKVLPNSAISTYVWGEIKNLNTLRAMINRIRKKVNGDLITNVNGRGYVIR